MPSDELIEAGARAIHREVCRHTSARWLRDERREETEDEAWDRRWLQTAPLTKQRYRDEARAALEAFSKFLEGVK